MRRVELHIVDLAGTIRIDEVGCDQILVIDAAGIADSQRGILNRAADRPPHIDHRKALLQQRISVAAEQVTHALGS